MPENLKDFLRKKITHLAIPCQLFYIHCLGCSFSYSTTVNNKGHKSKV
jgi:hypothetical protein